MVVVTGATGHIGYALVRELSKRGFDIRALVLPGEDTSHLSDYAVEFVTGDVRDISSLTRAFEGAKYVFHLAGIVSIGSGGRRLLHEVNVQGTHNVVEACRKAGVERLLYVSSIHAFREPPKGELLTESKEFDAKRVKGSYAKTKAEATLCVLSAAREGLDAVVVHPTGVIGPYEFRLSNLGQLVADFLRRRLYAYIEGGYDFVDVRDVAAGIVNACLLGKSGENYILSGERITVKELLRVLEQATGIPAPTFRIPCWLALATGPFSELYYKMRRQKPLYTSYSVRTLMQSCSTTCEKAVRELGYRHRPIAQSLRDTADWILNSFKPDK